MADVIQADVIPDAQQEFWRSPTVPAPAVEAASSVAVQTLADVCPECGHEFMIGARFCHSCGMRRPTISSVPAKQLTPDAITQSFAWARSFAASVAISWRKLSFPRWMRYLHFHEIQRAVGLPTASLVSFIIGLGCVAGAVAVSLFFKASNLAEFQAIQMWRIEWLLGATASFVAGILLKKPSRD
jgi:hypothetical protein